MWEAQIVGALAETRLLADEPTLQRSDDRRTASHANSEELVDPGPSGAKGMSACYRKQLGRQTAFCVVRVDSPSLTGSTATNCCMHDSPLQALGLLRAARPRLEISARMLEQGVRRTRRGSEMGHSAHLLAIPDGEPAVRRTHSI